MSNITMLYLLKHKNLSNFKIGISNDRAQRSIFYLCGFSYKEGCGYIGGINIVACTSGNNKFCTIQLTNLNYFFNDEGFESIKLLDVS